MSVGKAAESFLRNVVGTSMTDFEIRDPQLILMHSCGRNIEKGGVLMAEAGTGTGKTYAYLIPIILSGEKALISTKTINLQDQIMSEDLKVLSSLRRFTYAIVKGRGHYICIRRLNAFESEDDKEFFEYKRLKSLVIDDNSGDIDDLKIHIPLIRDKICSDADACNAKKCAYYRNCFYFRARQKWENAQILVVNHTLLAINSMLPEHLKILPKVGILVADEAHALDHVLSEVIGNTISNVALERILNKLLKLEDGKPKGILASSIDVLFPSFESMKNELKNFEETIGANFNGRATIKGVFKYSNMVRALSAKISRLNEEIRISTRGLFEEDQELELAAERKKLDVFSKNLLRFNNGLEGHVRWIELDKKKTTLRICPIYPKDFVVRHIVPDYKSIILTSATLSVAGDFGLTSNVLGLSDFTRIALPSPYNLKEQIEIVIEDGIYNMKNDEARKIADVIVKEGARKAGGILVLFTSARLMKAVRDLCYETLEEIGLNPMVQREMSNKMILQKMRKTKDAVVFGLDAFWEGVSVKGDSLKTLIITKLPFDVPTEPITAARMDIIKNEGGDGFRDYMLPRAILKFKQGFGRLIRSASDNGRVIICDDRIRRKDYGDLFKRSLF